MTWILNVCDIIIFLPWESMQRLHHVQILRCAHRRSGEMWTNIIHNGTSIHARPCVSSVLHYGTRVNSLFININMQRDGPGVFARTRNTTKTGSQQIFSPRRLSVHGLQNENNSKLGAYFILFFPRWNARAEVLSLSFRARTSLAGRSW